VTGTASFRFARWVPLLLKEYGVKAVIGKGGMSDQVYGEAFRRHGAVYLSTVGYGLGAKYGRSIEGVKAVYWREELGLAQALWVLAVQGMGPFLVECDAQGRGLLSRLKQEVDCRFLPLLESYPSATLKRMGEMTRGEQEAL
jgi:L(+)-tartrate dehydratase beta subunit